MEDRTLLAAFTVNSELDKVDLHPGDGLVDTGTSGEITLRAAVMEANASPGDDTINLPVGSYTLSVLGTGEDAAASGDLDVAENLTITGAGAATTIIDAAGIDRVLHLFAGVTLDLSGVTVTRGNLTGDGAGGIYNDKGTVTITNSTFSGNTAAKGGGIYIYAGTATITDSTLSGNRVEPTYSFGQGGGIKNSGTLTITGSTVSGNSAPWGGGGIYNGSAGTATIRNSTLSDNSGTYAGASTTVTMPR